MVFSLSKTRTSQKITKTCFTTKAFHIFWINSFSKKEFLNPFLIIKDVWTGQFGTTPSNTLGQQQENVK
jgi:hypothetical protein